MPMLCVQSCSIDRVHVVRLCGPRDATRAVGMEVGEKHQVGGELRDWNTYGALLETNLRSELRGCLRRIRTAMVDGSVCCVVSQGCP